MNFLLRLKSLLLLSLVSLSGSAVAADWSKVEVRHGAQLSPSAADAEVLKIVLPAEKQQWPPMVAFGGGNTFEKVSKLRISFQSRSSSPCKVRLTISDFAPPYGHLSVTERVNLTSVWQNYTLSFKLTAAPAGKYPKLNLPLMVFESYAGAATVEVRGLTVENASATAVPAKVASVGGASARIVASREWKAFDTGNLYIKKGSALDLTDIVERVPAGSHGRVIVNSHGLFAFADAPEKTVRFFSLQLMPEIELSSYTHEELAEFAAAIARQGYNMVRFHFLDATLLNSSRGAALSRSGMKKYSGFKMPERAADIKFDQERMDAFFYFAAELKKNGIYFNLDLMTSFVGYDNGRLREVDKTGDLNTKVQMFVNPMFRNNWKAGVTAFLTTVNPYTGLPLINDPAVALAVCLNEQEILIGFRDYSAAFQPRWIAWLKEKYGDYRKLYQAWGGKCGETALPENGSFEQVPGIGAETLKDTPAGRDMARCCGDMEAEMSRFYLDALSEIGYKGLVSSWNMRTRLGTVPARSLFPLIVMNCYHAHPSYGENKPAVDQTSALSRGGNSFKNQVMARFLDRPFFNTEFGLVFWNPYRHEQGLLYGAGAAFQDWSGLTCHAHQVSLSGNVLRWFDVGSDPIIRASELVAAFAFLRGDVKPSVHNVEIPVNDDFIFSGRGMRTISDELSRLWAVCRVGITYGPKKIDYPSVLSVRPDKTSGVGGGLMFTTVENADTVNDLAAAVRQLRAKGVLSAANRTDPARGIFQGDNGEILLDTAGGGELLVTTPRLEGAVVKQDKTVKLNAVTITGCSVPASITVISLDATAPLTTSRRLLLVFSTDALNSNMEFTDASHGRLTNLGSLPVLMRTGRLKMELVDRTVGCGKSRCFALKLNGERAEEIFVSREDGKLTLSIDTAALIKAGPTPFFEIVKE